MVAVVALCRHTDDVGKTAVRLSAAGAALTANALRPVPSSNPLAIPSFFLGWLTNELAPQNLMITAAASEGLLLRKRWAVKLLWLSLAGVLAQDIGMFVIAGGASLAGMVPTLLQAVVLVVAILLVLLARRAERAGWLG